MKLPHRAHDLLKHSVVFGIRRNTSYMSSHLEKVSYEPVLRGQRIIHVCGNVIPVTFHIQGFIEDNLYLKLDLLIKLIT